MFARLLSMTALVSTRFETPDGAKETGVPDVTAWLVPESVGRPLPAGKRPRGPGVGEPEDEEETEEFTIEACWTRLGSAVGEA